MKRISRSISSTAAPSDAPRLSEARTQQNRDRRFYLVMAVASAVLVFLAFARTYYLKAYFGTPQLTALVEFHGVVFTTWMVFFVAQTALIASNRPSVHRRLGFAGGALASVMVVLGTLVAVHAEKLGHRAAGADPETNFLFALGDILTFSIFVAAGFLWRSNREAHQRLMLLAVVAALLDAAPLACPSSVGIPWACLSWASRSSLPGRFMT